MTSPVSPSTKRARPESMAHQDGPNLKRSQPTTTSTSSSSSQAWDAAFPTPTLSVDAFPRRRALMILSMRIASLLLIDVRSTDYAGGSIRNSLNIPAPGFWWNRGMLYELAYKADVEWIVFVSSGERDEDRASKCAAWFLEHVRNTAGDEHMNVSVLEGGVEGWVRSGGEFIGFMDGFKEEYWVKVFGEEEERKRV